MPRVALRLALLLASLQAIAAMPARAQFVERVEVAVANVDVVVTDRDGNPIRGLTKDDFELYEEGKLQAITNFSVVDSASPASSGSTAASPEAPVSQSADARAAQPRLVLLFVDIAEIEPSRRVKFFEGVRAFFKQALRPGDLVCVLTWMHRVRVSLEPTADREALKVVLDALETPFGSKEKEIADRLAELQIQQAARDEALSRALGIAPLTDAAAEADFQAFIIDEERCTLIKRKVRELRNLLVSFSRVEMKKMLVFAGDDLSLRPRRDCDARTEIDQLADTANAYGMTIHAFHPPGMRDSFVTPDRGGFLPGMNAQAPLAAGYGRAFDEAGGLLALAKRTGGLSALGPQQSARFLERAARELDVYYSLGYRITSPADDKPRAIKVTAKNKSYHVRARESVVHLSEASRIRDLVTTNLYLSVPDESKGPAFDVRIGARKRDGRFVLVPVELAIDPKALVLLEDHDGRVRGGFTVFVTSGRELGDASDVSAMRQQLDFDNPDARQLPNPISYSFTVRVRPDTRKLSFALQDGTSGDLGTRVVRLQAGQ
ncbi:MAG: VWA domain-containing protein [Thermoanaerobaculia bacterium]|jgi:VWFA-related protein